MGHSWNRIQLFCLDSDISSEQFSFLGGFHHAIEKKNILAGADDFGGSAGSDADLSAGREEHRQNQWYDLRALSAGGSKSPPTPGRR